MICAYAQYISYWQNYFKLEKEIYDYPKQMICLYILTNLNKSYIKYN